MKNTDVEVKYTGTDSVTVRLRDQRNVAFGPELRVRSLPPGDAKDLVSLGRGTFELVKKKKPAAANPAKEGAA